MFNLYKNAINKNGFMGLVSNNATNISTKQNIHSHKIITGFAIMSIIIMSVISNGTASQNSFKVASIETETTYVTMA